MIILIGFLELEIIISIVVYLQKKISVNLNNIMERIEETNIQRLNFFTIFYSLIIMNYGIQVWGIWKILKLGWNFPSYELF